MWEDNKATSQLCRWRGENNFGLKVFSISTPWSFKDPQQSRSHIFIHTHTLPAVSLPQCGLQWTSWCPLGRPGAERGDPPARQSSHTVTQRSGTATGCQGALSSQTTKKIRVWVIDSGTNHNDPLHPQTSPQASHCCLLPPVPLSNHVFTSLYTKKTQALPVTSDFPYLSVKLVFLFGGLGNASLLPYIKQLEAKCLKLHNHTSKKDGFLHIRMVFKPPMILKHRYCT